MNPQLMTQIRNMVQQEIHRNSQSNKFNISPTSRHIHNDIDAPYVFQPFLQYVGAIDTNGSPLILPQGWTSALTGNNTYTITHNLNISTYVLSALQILPNTSIVGTPTVAPEVNRFIIGFLDVETGAGNIQTPFYFTLINFINKSTKLPVYYGPWLNTTQFSV